ncbi:hypothetical protein MKX03_035759 [Papaver bracteatum]|nr:hypothetical protein MKX03_035759 [Papaver bracteatum]
MDNNALRSNNIALQNDNIVLRREVDLLRRCLGVQTQTQCYHPSDVEPSTQYCGPETQNTKLSSQHFMAYREYASLLSSNSADLLSSLGYENS